MCHRPGLSTTLHLCILLKKNTTTMYYDIAFGCETKYFSCLLAVWAYNTDKDLIQGVQNIIWRLHFHINCCVGVQSVETATKLCYNYMLLDWNFKDLFLMLEKWLISWNGSWETKPFPWHLNLLAHDQCTTNFTEHEQLFHQWWKGSFSAWTN